MKTVSIEAPESELLAALEHVEATGEAVTITDDPGRPILAIVSLAEPRETTPETGVVDS